MMAARGRRATGPGDTARPIPRVSSARRIRRSRRAALPRYSIEYHLQSILLPGNPQVDTALRAEGCKFAFFNRVGTRIELRRATITGLPTPGGRLHVAVTLVNTGFGRVIRARPASWRLVSNGAVVAAADLPLSTLDLRRLAAADQPVAQTFQFDVRLPATFPPTGSVSAVLVIPDPAPSLRPQAAYALPLNSFDQHHVPVFDRTTGYNTLATFDAE
jgi:hypothetical protein